MEKPDSRIDQLFEETKAQRDLINSLFEINGEYRAQIEYDGYRMDRIENALKYICANYLDGGDGVVNGKLEELLDENYEPNN